MAKNIATTINKGFIHLVFVSILLLLFFSEESPPKRNPGSGKSLRHPHERTFDLFRRPAVVEIGAASREELEQATTKLRTAESEVASQRQRLVLLGLSELLPLTTTSTDFHTI
jgi:hypothetical protein